MIQAAYTDGSTVRIGFELNEAQGYATRLTMHEAISKRAPRQGSTLRVFGVQISVSIAKTSCLISRRVKPWSFRMPRRKRIKSTKGGGGFPFGVRYFVSIIVDTLCQLSKE